MVAFEQSAQMQRFVAAVAHEDDVTADTLATQLTVADEPALLASLSGANFDEQWWAMRALAHCGSAAAIEPIVQFLRSDNDELRLVAAKALGALGQRHGAAINPHLPALIHCFTDPAGFLRRVAAEAVAQCGNGAIPLLVDVLRYRNDQNARTYAAYALAQIATPEAAPALYRCLNDQNYLVHTYAHEALEKMGLLENILVQL